jgi:hypothetical protein
MALRQRLQVAWPAICLAALATFTALSVPMLLLYPAFNAVFNTAFGPYLWNPLQYALVTPSQTPVWGSVTYLGLTGLLGMIYYVRASRQESIRALFQIHTPARAHAWLLSLGAVRYVLDTVWSPEVRIFFWPVALLNYIVYQYVLYLVIPGLAGFLLGRVFSRPVDIAAVLRESALIWIIYPMVPLVSMITRSPSLQTIEWFRFVPTFMVENNFLPTGMLVAIPILIVFYTWQMQRHSAADLPRALVAVVAALLLFYVALYQYSDSLLFYTLERYGTLVAAGVYTLCFLAPLFPTAGQFHLAFGNQRITLPQLVWAAALLCLGLIAVGLLQGAGPMNV